MQATTKTTEEEKDTKICTTTGKPKNK